MLYKHTNTTKSKDISRQKLIKREMIWKSTKILIG